MKDEISMRKISGIKAVSFDGDDTLWDFGRVTRHALTKTLEELERIDAKAASRLDVEKMVKVREKVGMHLKGKVFNMAEIRLEAFREVLKEIGMPSEVLACRLNDIYFAHRFENPFLFSDTLPTLTALKSRFRLGLLSNGNAYPRHVGLDGIFDFVIFSQDYGIEKPDKRIFEIAVGKALCAKGEFLHVGDSLCNDIEGAMNAGVRCVWLNRNGARPFPPPKCESEISSLLELPGIL